MNTTATSTARISPADAIKQADVIYAQYNDDESVSEVHIDNEWEVIFSIDGNADRCAQLIRFELQPDGERYDTASVFGYLPSA